MLWFVGIGLSGPESISIETQKLLGQVDIVYLEQFTSPVDCLIVLQLLYRSGKFFSLKFH